LIFINEIRDAEIGIDRFDPQQGSPRPEGVISFLPNQWFAFGRRGRIQMPIFETLSARLRNGLLVAVGAACLSASVAGASLTASAQDDRGVTPPRDVISARKTLMVVIADNMQEIEAMLASGKTDLTRARANANSISAMLVAFPHLFPSSTNTWTPNAQRDPVSDTFTDPSLWKEFGFFYKEAQAAAKYAFDASRADTEADFRKHAGNLRLTCDTCHATFQKNN
jgi:cytochrome c556